MSEQWWDNPFRSFQTNLREIDAGLDVERVLDAIEEYGADTWLLSVGGIIANYPSELNCQTVNPALQQRKSGDLVGDAVKAASAREVRVLGRMDFSKIDARRAEEHPEWCFVSPAGEPQIYNGYRSVCPSGEYYQQKMFDVITEVLMRYDIAGFFFNWMSFNEYDYSRVYWGVCHCEPCVDGFQNYAPGTDLPSGPESRNYPLWKKFAEAVINDLHGRMQDHIRSIRPGIPLIMGDKADITFHEANNAVGRPLWHHRTAEQVSAARSGDSGRPVFVNSVGFVDMPYRWAGEDPHHFAQYLIQTIAHGAQPATYIMGTPDHSIYGALEVGGEITRFHRDHQELYRGLASTAQTALVRSSRQTDPESERRRAEFEGQYLSLVESHIPFDVLRQDRLAGADPRRYSLILLPDLGELHADEVTFLGEALDAGVHVVATGDSAWRGSSFQLGGGDVAVQRASFLTKESLRSLHLPLGDSGDYVPVLGGFHVLDPGEAVTTDWPALGRALYGPPEKCYGHSETSHPAWVSARAGAGTVSCAPWRPGLVYREIGLARVRDVWTEKLLQTAGQHLRIGGDIPEQLEVVTGRNVAGEQVVHLLNRSGDAVQRFRSPLTMQPGALHLSVERQPAQVEAHVSGRKLESAVEAGVLTVQIPAVERFEVLSISAQQIDMKD